MALTLKQVENFQSYTGKATVDGNEILVVNPSDRKEKLWFARLLID